MSFRYLSEFGWERENEQTVPCVALTASTLLRSGPQCSRPISPAVPRARSMRGGTMEKSSGLLWRFSWPRVILLKVLLCSIGAAGQLALSSSTSNTSNLNFGSVQVGTSSTLAISASNTGKLNLTIAQATVSGSAFSYGGPTLPTTVAPGQSVRLAVIFTPPSAGSASGSMSVVTSTRIGNSNKQRFNASTISLAGTGTPPFLGRHLVSWPQALRA